MIDRVAAASPISRAWMSPMIGANSAGDLAGRASVLSATRRTVSRVGAELRRPPARRCAGELVAEDRVGEDVVGQIVRSVEVTNAIRCTHHPPTA